MRSLFVIAILISLAIGAPPQRKMPPFGPGKRPMPPAMQSGRALVLTMFKVGSWSMVEALQLARVPTVKQHQWHGVDQLAPSKRRVWKPSEFSDVITLVRSPLEMYASALFQDIDNRAYEYYYGPRAQVLAARPQQLVDHFLSFGWHQYQWLNIDYYADVIRSQWGVDIFNENITNAVSRRGYAIVNSTEPSEFEDRFTRVVVVKMEHLSSLLSPLMAELGYNPVKKTTEGKNRAQNKWYADKYREFLKELSTRVVSECDLTFGPVGPFYGKAEKDSLLSTDKVY